MLKNCWFFNGFEKAVFWSLKLLMALLGSSCCFLGKSGSKMGFQNGYQKWSLKTLKIEFKMKCHIITSLLWFNFLVLLGVFLGILLRPILKPKIGPKFVNFWVNFGSLFFGV